MKFEIAEKVAWVQQRLHLRRRGVLVLVSSCSASLLLLFPRVQALLIYFWPLLLSTALFVAALLTIGESKVEEKEEEEGEEGTWQQELEHVVEAFPQLERERSIIECVAEQHQGGMLHFDTLFLYANGEEEDVKEQSLSEISEEKGDQSSVAPNKGA